MGLLDAFLRFQQPQPFQVPVPHGPGSGIDWMGNQIPQTPVPQMQQPAPSINPMGFTPPLGAFRSPSPMQAPQPMQTSMPQMQQPPSGPAAPFRPSAGARVREFFDPESGTGLYGPNMALAMTLLGEGQNGGNWSNVAQAQQGIQQNQQQQNLMRRQIRREDAADARQQTEQGRADQQYANWQSAVQGEQDPQRRATLLALGPQGYAQYLDSEQRNAQFGQELEARREEGRLNRENDIRVAGIRSANENNLGRYFQQMDASTLGELNQQAAQLQAVGLPGLRQLRETINQAGSSLTGRPIDYNDRIQLSRVFNGSSSDRQTLEVWRAQILGPALETLRGLGAMSEREMEAAVNSFSNPNMTLGSAMQLIDEKIATAERRVATAQATSEFFADANGITGVRNQAGQDYATFLQERIGASPGAGGAGGATVPRGGYPQPSPEAVTELRRDTSAAARREFDQMFGPGAAARALAAPQRSLGRARPSPGRAPGSSPSQAMGGLR